MLRYKAKATTRTITGRGARSNSACIRELVQGLEDVLKLTYNACHPVTNPQIKGLGGEGKVFDCDTMPEYVCVESI